jgi:predicted acylesterase/phospholipase RssA
MADPPTPANGNGGGAPAEISAATGELLELQRMEAALVRARLARPDVLDPETLGNLRYLLSFARLTRFQPGAAKAGGRLDGPHDVDVADEVAPFRARALETLRRPLRQEADPARRLHEAEAALDRLAPQLNEIRDAMTRGRRKTVKVADLDTECGSRTLVGVAGGGGGAGYVYVGAFHYLEDKGLVPRYLVGASIGAVLGCFRARAVPGRWGEWIAIAEQIDSSELFTRPEGGRRYGLPGMMGLNLDAVIGQTMADESGRRLRLDELAMPFDVVVAGVRRRSFERLPERFRSPGADGRPDRTPGRLASGVAVRMWQVAAFVDPRIVKTITLGADELTSRLPAVHAAGFSASIPGVLHYDVPPSDEVSSAILDQLLSREEVAALIDGGAASNVPVEQAWRQVQAGRIGTRNAVYLALDCFHPSWDPSHLWLQPITQGVQLQMNRNARFADWIVRFDNALSPVTLVPGKEKIRKALTWGREAVTEVAPMLQAMLQPVRWSL